MKEILTKMKMQICQQLLILLYQYSFQSLESSQLIKNVMLKTYPKSRGIPFVEIVWFMMSANDGLDHTSDQPSSLMNYMPHKYDINIYSMLVNKLNATNLMKLSLEVREWGW